MSNFSDPSSPPSSSSSSSCSCSCPCHCSSSAVAARQQSSSEENNSDWDMANDVFVSCYEDPQTLGEAAAAEDRMMDLDRDRDRHHLLLLPPLIRAEDHHHHHHHQQQHHHGDAAAGGGGGADADDGMLMGLGYLDVVDVSDYGDGSGDRIGVGDGGQAKTRNRPSNSSRHRGEVVTDLGPEEVRWFYKEDKRTWKPFVGHDSLKIETVYRRFWELDPDKVRRRERQRQRRRTGSDAEPQDPLVETQAESQAEAEPEPTAAAEFGPRGSVSDLEAVCVRGGLYEVDVKDKESYPVYWNQQDRIPVMRGQWFIGGTWLPLEEDESDGIELEHLVRFRGQQMRDTYELEEAAAATATAAAAAAAAAVETKDAIYSLKLSRSHVDWHSVDEVYLYSDATTSKIARTVTQRLGFPKASRSSRLHRGYVEEAAPEDTPPETTHIVFVVHGIGQKMDQGRIIRNTSMMRDAARKMEEKHFSNRTTEHVEFLPVEWRSKLALDGDTVDSITPDKVRGLRDMLNGSAMDIMYYTSPLYRDEITRGLTLELNRLYTLFCTRNPEFQESGKVSIVSHSLGCVITFDIMTGWDPVRFHHQEAPDPEETRVRWPSHEERHLQEQLRLTRLRLRDLEDQFQGLQTSSFVAVPALKFKVENFFCMGSPLAVFLALRGIRPGLHGTQDHILPKSICQRLFNIFHPTDPVAYRLEPLVLKHYSNISPVQINWYNTVNPTPYDSIRPTLINPLKESTSISDSESLPSPCTSPPQARRPYGESITSLGKASIMGAASIGKGISGILFSRFSRSSGHVGGVEEEPSDVEGGATEVEGVAGAGLGEDGGRGGGRGGVVVVVSEGEEKEKAKEEETKEAQPTMSQSTSAILESTSVELECRVDFELREGLVESRYVTAVTSHTAYWCSHDVALFLLTFMYRPQDPPPEPPDTAEQP